MPDIGAIIFHIFPEAKRQGTDPIGQLFAKLRERVLELPRRFASAQQELKQKFYFLRRAVVLCAGNTIALSNCRTLWRENTPIG
jgi:hypothetical protein